MLNKNAILSKNAKYRVKNAQGVYEVVHLETNVDQVLETEQKHFIQAEAGRILGVSAGSIKQILAKRNKSTKDANGNKYTFSKISLRKEKEG